MIPDFAPSAGQLGVIYAGSLSGVEALMEAYSVAYQGTVRLFQREQEAVSETFHFRSNFNFLIKCIPRMWLKLPVYWRPRRPIAAPAGWKPRGICLKLPFDGRKMPGRPIGRKSKAPSRREREL